LSNFWLVHVITKGGQVVGLVWLGSLVVSVLVVRWAWCGLHSQVTTLGKLFAHHSPLVRCPSLGALLT